MPLDQGPTESRFEVTNLNPKNNSKFQNYEGPNFKRYSEREIFGGKAHLSKPRPEYEPQKEILLKPLSLGIMQFDK